MLRDANPDGNDRMLIEYYTMDKVPTCAKSSAMVSYMSFVVTTVTMLLVKS